MLPALFLSSLGVILAGGGLMLLGMGGPSPLFGLAYGAGVVVSGVLIGAVYCILARLEEIRDELRFISGRGVAVPATGHRVSPAGSAGAGSDVRSEAGAGAAQAGDGGLDMLRPRWVDRLEKSRAERGEGG